MTLFDNMIGGLPERHAVVAFLSLAVLIILAAVAWWRIRRAAARRPLSRASRQMVEQRAWSFCPSCGWPRPADGSVSSADLATTRIRDAITVAGASTTDMRLLPSTLLRQGWTRAAAIDAEGRIVTPCHSSATAFSIWGAGNRAFDPDGKTWREWIRHLTEILDERYSGVSMQQWNRDVGRTHREVVALTVEIERTMGLGRRHA